MRWYKQYGDRAMYELTINGETIYVLDGYFYTIDTIVIEDLFTDIGV